MTIDKLLRHKEIRNKERNPFIILRAHHTKPWGSQQKPLSTWEKIELNRITQARNMLVPTAKSNAMSCSIYYYKLLLCIIKGLLWPVLLRVKYRQIWRTQNMLLSVFNFYFFETNQHEHSLFVCDSRGTSGSLFKY